MKTLKDFLKETMYDPDYAPVNEPIEGDPIDLPGKEEEPDYVPKGYGTVDSNFTNEIEESVFCTDDGSTSGEPYSNFEDDYTKAILDGDLSVE